MRTKQYPVNEFGEPERADGENWFHYYRRWWFHWASIEAEKRRVVMSGQHVITATKRWKEC